MRPVLPSHFPGLGICLTCMVTGRLGRTIFERHRNQGRVQGAKESATGVVGGLSVAALSRSG